MIDWTKPLELTDGTPVHLCELGYLNGPNPDLHGDYLVEREDGDAFYCTNYSRRLCVGPDGDASHVGLWVRNREAM